MKSKHLGIFLSLMSAGSFASNYSNTDLKVKELDFFSSDGFLSGDVGFQTNALMDDVGEVPGHKYFGSFNLNYKNSEDVNFQQSLEISTRVNNENVVQYSIPSANIVLEYSTSRFVIGRSNLDWSYTDQVWGLGKVNNRVNFDYFEPGSEGLVGIVYDRKFNTGFDISIFASGLYVPEMSQGMEIDKKSRTITCKTAWCDAPTSSAEIRGREIPIYYDVNYPKTEDVIYRASLGYRLGYALDEKFTVSLFHLNKPENELSVSAEIVVEPDFSAINAEVTPQFYYHDVIGHNVEYKYSDELKLYASRLGIIPNKYPDGDEPYIQYTGIKPKKKREDYLSTGLFFNNTDWSVHTGYIARISEFDTESDILVSYPRWNQAVNVGIAKRLSGKTKVAFDFKYDMLTEDRLTMFKANHKLSSNFVAAFGVNVIGTNKNKESYWSKFENNDSVYSSLKYLF